MGSKEVELASLLVGVGKRLLEMMPPTVRELLAVLNRVEVYLSRVEQSPSKVIQTALVPVKKALIDDRLLRHVNVDVKVAVASCLNEITRITAPDIPYEDNQMKDAFQLIVSTFERLHDESRPSYAKRISILETVAKVRSCVLMLDLECDELVLVMFRHFIQAIRDYHPETVVTSMENIMIRIVDESEEISPDLLFCILDSVKKDNMEVTPVARKMMEKVIQTCGDKLVPYIKTAVRTGDLLLADYDEVLSHLCLETSAETAGQSEHGVRELADGSRSTELSSDALQNADDVPVVIDTHPGDGISDALASNGIAEDEIDTLSVSSTVQDSKSSKTEMVPDTITGGPSAAVSDPDWVGVETNTEAPETIKTAMKKGGKKIPESKLAGKFSNAVKQVDELAGPQRSSSEPNCPSQGKELSNEAADHSSAKPLETDDVTSKRISGEAGEMEKLDECSKSKTGITILDNHASVDVKVTTSAVSDLEERTTTLKVDASEVEATVPQANIPVEKTDALNDENSKEDTVILPVDAVLKGAAPLLDEPLEEVRSSVGKSPEQLAGLSKDTHDADERTAIPKVDAAGVKATAPQADVLMENSDVPNDENQKEDTVILTSDVVPEGTVPIADEPLEEVEASIRKSPEQATRKVYASSATTPQADMPVRKTIAPNYENPEEDTVILPSDVVLEGASHIVDEPLGEVESSVGKSPEQLAGLSKDTEANNDIRTRGRSKKATLRKHAAQPGSQNNNKDATTSRKLAMNNPIVNEENLKETPKSSSKRKRTDENYEGNKDYGEELVGSKVKVWWPADKAYYKGVIESFDSAKKKHKVLYADGEVEHLVLRRQRWEVVNPAEDSDTESNERTPRTASGKRHKGNEVTGGTSRKRLGRPSSKAKSASSKPVRKRADIVKSDRKSRSDSKARGEAKADNSEKKEKSEVVIVKKLGRPRANVSKSAGKRNADVSKSAGKWKADVSKSAGKRRADKDGKAKADESKRTRKSTSAQQDVQYSRKSRTGKSDSNAARETEAEASDIKRRESKGKGTKSAEETPLTKSAGNSRTRRRNKTVRGSAVNSGTRKAIYASKSKGKSPKTSSKKAVKVSEKAKADSKVTGIAADDKIPSPAKEAGSRKRKAPALDKESTSGAKSSQKRKRGRK